MPLKTPWSNGLNVNLARLFFIPTHFSHFYDYSQIWASCKKFVIQSISWLGFQQEFIPVDTYFFFHLRVVKNKKVTITKSDVALYVNAVFSKPLQLDSLVLCYPLSMSVLSELVWMYLLLILQSHSLTQLVTPLWLTTYVPWLKICKTAKIT